MPELPEVESTVRLLRPDLQGRTFTNVQLNWPRHAIEPEVLQSLLPGRKVAELGRRGKYIVIKLNPPDRTLLIHLMMSGRLAVFAADVPLDKHDHTIFSLDDGRQLRFNDTRKFGKIYFPADPQKVLGKLGPEPLSDDFGVDWLVERLSKRTRVIKGLLLEQRFLAGLGNIYADEALFRAKVDPRRAAHSLTPQEAAALHQAIREVLTEAIEHQGTSFDWVYPNGGMQQRLRVYGRAGEPCLVCGKEIQRVVLVQRGTHLCPRCQR